MSSANFREKRTLIVCGQAEECELIAKQLIEMELPAHKWSILDIDKRNKLPSLICFNIRSRFSSSVAGRQQHHSAKNYWTEKSGILICSDETLSELDLRDAEITIHYSLPEKYLNFIYRFSSSIDFYKDIVASFKHFKRLRPK